ncbi:MAG: lactonase family protein [Acetobacteraceae bacterium]|nr:lactonase family protein [Acetobacteraceae bacterium]
MSELLAFVSCADARAIETFAMDRTTGALTHRATTAVPGPAGASMSMPLALSPDRRTLHAAVRLAPFPCSSFAVDPASGALRHIGAADLSDAMAYILVDPSGKNLLAASYPGAIVTSHAIGPDGAVTGPARQVIDTPLRAHAIITDAAGHCAYVPCLGGDVVLQMALDPQSGRMMQVGRLATHPGSGPRHMRFSPEGRHAYIVGELDAQVIACTVDAAGHLAAFQRAPMLADSVAIPEGSRIAAADIQVTPDGRFLYATERMTNIIAAWRLDPETGAMTTVGAVPAEPGPRGIAIDPAGRFLLCAGQTTGAVGTYAIDQGSGALTRIATTPAGANANWIEFLETKG